MDTRIAAIREAITLAAKELDCSDWGEIDVNGEGAMRPRSHDIVAEPNGCPACKVRQAIAHLDALEAELKGEPRPTTEDVKRWYQLLVGLGEDAMYKDMGNPKAKPPVDVAALSADTEDCKPQKPKK